MINYNNYNITGISYNNHSIKYVYGCGGNLVWSSTPTPIYRWIQTDITTCSEGFKVNRKILNDSWTDVNCDTTGVITRDEILKVNGTIVTPNSFKEIVFGDCITSIGTLNDSVTIGCCQGFPITAVTIPDNVSIIGNYAFYGCSSLTSITVEATIPPTLGNNVFDNTNNCPIYVPDVDAYKSASGWSEYKNLILPIT